MCTNFWENKLAGFWLMNFASNRNKPGQNMNKQLGSNGVNRLELRNISIIRNQLICFYMMGNIGR